jgi:hypothetical protein
MLSHLVDFASIADRSITKIAVVGALTLELAELQKVHAKILEYIAQTIRWGFVPASGAVAEQIGEWKNGLPPV